MQLLIGKNKWSLVPWDLFVSHSFIHVNRCGGAVDPQDGVTFLAAPPVGVMLGQEIVESQKATTDGVIKKSSFLQQSFFALSCSVDTASVILYPLEISMTLFSPTSGKCDKKEVDNVLLQTRY